MTMTTHEKAEKLDTAMRTERDRLRREHPGQADAVRTANNLNAIVQQADEETKARLFDLMIRHETPAGALAELENDK